MDFLEQELRDTRAAMEYTTSRRADGCMYGELCSMYADARMSNDPFLLDDYPDEEEIRRYLEVGELYALWMDTKPVGAYVLTHDPVFSLDEEVLFRHRNCRRILPGENWFYPGKDYLTIKYPAVRPPLDPYYDMGALLEHAIRTAVDSGIYSLRTKVNLQDRGSGRIYLKAGFLPACTVRRPSNEAYVGFFLDRYPAGVFPGSPRKDGYRSPTFERLTEEEYGKLLEKLGIDEEEDLDDPFARRREDGDIVLPSIKRK